MAFRAGVADAPGDGDAVVVFGDEGYEAVDFAAELGEFGADGGLFLVVVWGVAVCFRARGVSQAILVAGVDLCADCSGFEDCEGGSELIDLVESLAVGCVFLQFGDDLLQAVQRAVVLFEQTLEF